MYCQLIEQACDSDADCAAGLECESFGDAPTCISTDETDPDPCGDGDEPPATSYCVPPDFGYWGYDEGGSTRVANSTGHEEANLKSADREGFFGGERDGTKADAGGCSQAGAASTPLWLLLLGFGFLRRRRQERPVE
jgi:MYXO-CTERM domain-containing protein